MKNTNIYATKGAFEIKDLDLSKREVAVYLAKFDNVDADLDVIRKGAFTKSIKERGPESISNRKIAFLRHHDFEQQIGKFQKLEQDDYGLFAVGFLGTSSKGEDALRDYSEGIIREHSIGFQYVADKIKWVDDQTLPSGGFYDITELKLWEGSAVTFGANDMTNVIEVMKSEHKHDFITKTSTEIDTLIKSLANGKGSDERLFEIEMRLKYLNGQLFTLLDSEPIIKDHLDGKKSIETIQQPFDWSKVYNNL